MFRRSGVPWCVGAPVAAAIGIGVVAAAILDALTGFGVRAHRALIRMRALVGDEFATLID